MTRLLVICCFSLLLPGVSGTDVTVTVMKGDNVTLLINPEEIKDLEKWLWKFNDKYIATIDLEVKPSQAKYPDERFRGRLNLEHNTVSLTINNFRTEDKGEYTLEIKMTSKSPEKYKKFSVTVNDEPSTLSVIKGDAVTLSTGVKIRPDDVQWKFKGNIIPNLTDSTITKMKSGELHITKIQLDQSGEYEVEINTTSFIIHRIIHVNVIEVELVLRTKDELIYLNATTEPQADDVIEWKFENTVLTKVNKAEFPLSEPVFIERFKDRIYVDVFGSLIIANIKTEDSGLYDVNITNRNHIIHKRFKVTVTDVFSADVTVIVMEGDPVTLPINLDERKVAEKLLWKFKYTDIATIDLEEENGQVKYNNNKTFGGRLNLDLNTGYLTINNIRTNDTGEYQLEIRSSGKAKHKTFSVTVNEVESVSGMKTETLTLKTNTQPQADDVIEWKFKNTLITKVDKTAGPSSIHVLDKRFRDRLHVDVFGSLIITNIKTNESGIYDVKITNSKHIIDKRFRVNVTDSSSGSHQVKIGLFVVVIMLLTTLVMPVTGDY